MAQVATVGALTDVLAAPSIGAITRDTATGYLYVAFQSAAGTLTVNRSTDGGTSWVFWAAFTQSGLAEWSSLVIDGGWGHLAYRVSTTGGGGTDTIWYRRLLVSGTTGSWSAGLRTSALDANGGTAGATWQGVDLAAVRISTGAYAIVVAGARTVGTRYGVQVMAVSITADAGAIYLNNAIINGTRAWTVDGGAPGRSGVVAEVEHNGNGQTSSTPNVWIAWGRQRLEMVRLSWIGQGQGWTGPTSSTVFRAGLPVALDNPAARWDGAQFVMAIASPDDTTRVRIYQRGRANIQSIVSDSPAHPQGVPRSIATSYDGTTRNLRLYAIGTSNTVLYYIDYLRVSSTWTSWVAVNGTTLLGVAEWSVRRGGSSGNSRYDLVYAVAGSPNTIQHLQQVVSTAPAIATWNYTGAAYTNGGAADVAAPLAFAWTFTDADPGDSQGFYALSRQIGASALQYWNASTSTWGGSEAVNASATNGMTLAAAWGADADAPHAYRVKVYDASGVSSADYSAPLALTPSAKVNPTVSAPAAAAVLITDSVTVTWTVAEQTAYRVQLVSTALGTAVYDSGKQVGLATSVVLPYRLPNGTAWTVTVWTYNNEGLASTGVTRAFTVAYTPPPVTTNTSTPSTASGWMLVTPASVAPVGVQPATVSQDLYRRTRKTFNTLANPGMAGNVTGYVSLNGTLSYSTAQAHAGPGSARLVPTAGLDSQVVLAAPQALVAGAAYYAQAWIRPDTNLKLARLQLSWYDGGGNFIDWVGISVPVVAGAWQYLEVVGSPAGVPGAASVAIAVGLTGTPAASDAFYVDDLYLSVADPDAGVRIAQLLEPGAAVRDWGAPGRTDLEYRFVATGANGASINGPWAG